MAVDSYKPEQKSSQSFTIEGKGPEMFIEKPKTVKE